MNDDDDDEQNNAERYSGSERVDHDLEVQRFKLVL